MEKSLKPCPFCGGEASIGIARLDDKESYSVICKNCHVGIFRPRFVVNSWEAYKNAEDAVNAWNRRTKNE